MDEWTLDLIFDYISAFVLVPNFTTLVSLIVIRFWLLYYNMEFSKYTKNQNWQKAININPAMKGNRHDDHENNSSLSHWTMTHGHTLGNPKFWFKLDCIIIVIATIIGLLAYVFVSSSLAMVGFVHLVIALFMIIFAVYTWFRMKNMKLNYKYDNFGIRKEFHYILYISIYAILSMFPLTALGSDSGRRIAWYIGNILGYFNLLAVASLYIEIITTNVIKANTLLKHKSKTQNNEKKYTLRLNFSKLAFYASCCLRCLDDDDTVDTSHQTGRNRIQSDLDRQQSASSTFGRHLRTGTNSILRVPSPASPVANGNNNNNSEANTTNTGGAEYGKKRKSWSVSIMSFSITARTNTTDLKPGKTTERVYDHWSKIIVTSVGYELFINYLETEFSIENLLFITEVELFLICCYLLFVVFLFCLHEIKSGNS